MDNTWIKLYRKLDNNDLIKDAVALQIFVWLLVNVDRKTGSTTVGRFWTSKELGLKPTTFYQALKRLETKYKIVSLMTKKVTIKYTEVRLLNWDKYQSKDMPLTQDNDNSLTIKRQFNDNSMTHIQEVKNKEERIDTIGKSPKISIKGFSGGVNERVYKSYELERGIEIMDRVEDHNLSVLESKTGITKEWQEKAFRYADKLKIKLDGSLKPRWLKVFKQAHEGRNAANLEKAYSYLADYSLKPLTSMQKALYFFSIYENGMKPMNFT